MNIRHILVTTDLSTEALRPCSPVADLAQALGARITLLHVVEHLGAIPHGSALAPPLEPPGLGTKMDEARAALQAQRESFGTGSAVASDVITGADVSRAIAEYARTHEVDLIALSTHGRTGFRHLVLGSVAEALIRHADVPVVVFPRPQDRERRIPEMTDEP